MRHARAPIARAAVTYSCSLIASVDARATRAYTGMLTMLTARMVLLSPGPRMATMPIARITEGNASMTSIVRMIAPSTRPPRYPAVMPRRAPVVSAPVTATNPTVIEMRAP